MSEGASTGIQKKTTFPVITVFSGVGSGEYGMGDYWYMKNTAEHILEITKALSGGLTINRRKLIASKSDKDFKHPTRGSWITLMSPTELDFTIREEDGRLTTWDYRVKPDYGTAIPVAEEASVKAAESAVNDPYAKKEDLQAHLKEILYLYRTYRGHFINLQPLYVEAKETINELREELSEEICSEN